MKIAIINDTFQENLGGLTQFVRFLAKGLCARGIKVKVFCLECDKNNHNNLCCPLPKLTLSRKYHANVLRTPKILLNHLSNFSPDIIHNHSQFQLGLAAIKTGRILNIPVLHQYHCILEHSLNYLPRAVNLFEKGLRTSLRRYTSYFFNKADRILCPSVFARNYLRAIGVTQPLSLIPLTTDFQNPIAAKKSRREDDLFVVIVVSRLHKEKKVGLAIDAFAKLLPKKNVRLIIVGEGDQKKHLIKKARTRGIENQVNFIGWIQREQIEAVYNSASVLLTLCDIETFGLSVLEAFHHGLPVIAAHGGATIELVKNGSNGFLIRSNDAGEAAEKLKTLCNDPLLYENMSRAACITAKQYSQEAYFSNLFSIYKQLISTCS